VEEALSGAPASSPAGPPQSRRRDAAAPAAGTAAFLERLKKTRPATAAFLADATLSQEGNILRVTLADAFAAERVRDAQSVLDEIARELFGAGVKVEVAVLSEEKPTAAAPKAAPLREDPVVQAFQKHLGGELVEPRKR
jgi:hypothetical protein